MTDTDLLEALRNAVSKGNEAAQREALSEAIEQAEVEDLFKIAQEDPEDLVNALLVPPTGGNEMNPVWQMFESEGSDFCIEAARAVCSVLVSSPEKRAGIIKMLRDREAGPAFYSDESDEYKKELEELASEDEDIARLLEDIF